MSNAPERIWAWIDYDGNWDGTWLAHSETMQPERLPDAQYVRADIAEAEKRGAVAAAYEAAANLHDETFTDKRAKRAYWQSDMIRALADTDALDEARREKAKDVDAAAMRLAREWAHRKGGHLIPQETTLDDLQDPDFLRALAAAAIREDK